MTLPPPQDTLRECAREDKHCLSYLPALSPVYFVTFVLVAQFVLVNVVVAVLMKHLEESNKEAREDAEMDAEIELEMAQGSAAQPPSAAQVRLLRGPRRVPGFLGGAAEPDKQLSAPQESPGTQPDSPNLLVVRKVSVSRMLSLPNDSYMFRPVAPAIVPHPHPLQEVEMETYAGSAPSGMDSGRAGEKWDWAGRLDRWEIGPPVGEGWGPSLQATQFRCIPTPGPVTSAHSPPLEPRASFQVPSAASSPARASDPLRALSPRGTPRSLSLSRILCRQVRETFVPSHRPVGLPRVPFPHSEC